MGVFVKVKFGPILLKLGTEVGFFAGQDLNFNDPNGDGRVRASGFDRLTDFNPVFGSGTGSNAFSNELRLEVRWDIFARIRINLLLT